MINEKIELKGKLNTEDMKEIQLDTFDVLMETLLDDMIISLRKGLD
jgi:hypothetical protein